MFAHHFFENGSKNISSLSVLAVKSRSCEMNNYTICYTYCKVVLNVKQKTPFISIALNVIDHIKSFLIKLHI